MPANPRADAECYAASEISSALRKAASLSARPTGVGYKSIRDRIPSRVRNLDRAHIRLLALIMPHITALRMRRRPGRAGPLARRRRAMARCALSGRRGSSGRYGRRCGRSSRRSAMQLKRAGARGVVGSGRWAPLLARRGLRVGVVRCATLREHGGVDGAAGLRLQCVYEFKQGTLHMSS